MTLAGLETVHDSVTSRRMVGGHGAVSKTVAREIAAHG
jgi:hypothetical protein